MKTFFDILKVVGTLLFIIMMGFTIYLNVDMMQKNDELKKLINSEQQRIEQTKQESLILQGKAQAYEEMFDTSNVTEHE